MHKSGDACILEAEDILTVVKRVSNVGSITHSKNISHHDSVLINRLQPGYCQLTHSHLSTGDNLPMSEPCSNFKRLQISNLVDVKNVVKLTGIYAKNPRTASTSYSKVILFCTKLYPSQNFLNIYSEIL